MHAGEIDIIALPCASFGLNAGSAKVLLSKMYQKRKGVSVFSLIVWIRYLNKIKRLRFNLGRWRTSVRFCLQDVFENKGTWPRMMEIHKNR
jgi:hypothetical protein